MLSVPGQRPSKQNGPGQCARGKGVLDLSPRPTLSIGRRQMRRGDSKAKGLKRGGRTRSVATKPKTRVGRKDTSAHALATKLAAKTRELDEAAAAASGDRRNSQGDFQFSRRFTTSVQMRTRERDAHQPRAIWDA